jgi:hypothetical protein
MVDLTNAVGCFYAWVRLKAALMKLKFSPSQVDLDPKLEAVLARLCERLGDLCKTQAVKLPYLVDVVASHALGRTITAAKHQTWKRGVVTKEAYVFMTYQQNDSVFAFSNEWYELGKHLRLVGKPRISLSAEEQVIVDFVADEFGHLGYKQLGQLTKNMNTHLTTEDWGANTPAAVDEDSYARLSPGWQAFCRRLASIDLNDRSHWVPIDDDPAADFKRLLNE